MLKVFRSTEYLYYLFYFAGLFLILLLAIPYILIFPTINPLLAIILFLVWCFVDACIFDSIADKKMNKILSIMNNDCNMQEYIDILNKLLERDIAKKTKQYLLFNLSTAYLNRGDGAAAKQVLDNIGDFPNNRMGAINKVCYYNNLFVYYNQINDTLNATDILEKFKFALDNVKLPKTSRDHFYIVYSDKLFLLNIANGNFVGAEQVFSIKFEREAHTLGKVSAQFILGKMYLHYSKFEEAREAFIYAINNGGDTYYVEESKYFLTQIPE